MGEILSGRNYRTFLTFRHFSTTNIFLEIISPIRYTIDFTFLKVALKLLQFT